MGIGEAYKDLEFLERALEFASDDFMRLKIRMAIKFAKDSIANHVERRLARGDISEDAFTAITGERPPKQLVQMNAPFRANEYTVFARNALLDNWRKATN